MGINIRTVANCNLPEHSGGHCPKAGQNAQLRPRINRSPHRPSPAEQSGIHSSPIQEREGGVRQTNRRYLILA